jgi:hypothetical protein
LLSQFDKNVNAAAPFFGTRIKGTHPHASLFQCSVYCYTAAASPFLRAWVEMRLCGKRARLYIDLMHAKRTDAACVFERAHLPKGHAQLIENLRTRP